MRVVPTRRYCTVPDIQHISALVRVTARILYVHKLQEQCNYSGTSDRSLCIYVQQYDTILSSTSLSSTMLNELNIPWNSLHLDLDLDQETYLTIHYK